MLSTYKSVHSAIKYLHKHGYKLKINGINIKENPDRKSLNRIIHIYIKQYKMRKQFRMQQYLNVEN